MHKLLLFFSLFLFIACSKDQGLRKGTFYLYEEGKLVDTLYRMENYQIEAANGKQLIVKLDWISNDSVVISGVEPNPKGIEAIEFVVWHEKLEANRFKIYGKPLYSTLKYSYKGEIEKVSKEIQRMDFLRKLEELNSNQ